MNSKRIAAAFALATTFSLLAAQATFAAHAVRHQGTHQIKQTWGVDFDGGVFNGHSISREDMQFNAVTLNHRYLLPEGASTMAKMGSFRPTYAACAKATLSSQEYNVAQVRIGTWFCFKTPPGRFVQFRVDSVHPDPGPITITYTTWEL